MSITGVLIIMSSGPFITFIAWRQRFKSIKTIDLKSHNAGLVGSNKNPKFSSTSFLCTSCVQRLHTKSARVEQTHNKCS
jgi:hypothetical protein